MLLVFYLLLPGFKLSYLEVNLSTTFSILVFSRKLLIKRTFLP